MTCRISYIFNAQAQGWSEVWYVANNFLADALALAITGARYRAQLLAPGITLEDIRVNVDGQRPAIHKYGVQNIANAGKVANGDGDQVTNAILVSCFGANGAKRKMWLRGIPDDWITYDDQHLPKPFTTECKDRFLPWNVWATTNGAGGPLQIRYLNPANPKVPIQGLAADTTPGYTIISANGHGCAAGDSVRIKLVQGLGMPAGINGVFQVLAPVVPNVSFRIAATMPAPPNVYTNRGYLRKRVFIFDNISRMQLDRFDKRNTGRAFFVPPGRRSGVKKS